MNSIVSVSGNNGTTVTIGGKTYKLPAGSVNVVDGKIYHLSKLGRNNLKTGKVDGINLRNYNAED
jgi:hypothetical protein